MYINKCHVHVQYPGLKKNYNNLVLNEIVFNNKEAMLKKKKLIKKIQDYCMRKYSHVFLILIDVPLISFYRVTVI